jgi:CheY-like chemotaxis protein
MSKTALIVDDSPLALHVLSRLLAEHGVAADTAPSAESALEYLKQRRPDVIFMDHLMPGMDGFEALEAIKANPATATIPVMMYTSQEGELYVGQARALGAFGVLPKDLKPVEVARVLKALHLIPGDRASDRAAQSMAHDHSEPGESQRVRELLEELFHQQRSALREEIRQGYQRALASTHTQLPAVAPALAPPKRLGFAGIAAIGLAVLAAIFGALYFNASRLMQETAQRSSQLIASSAELNVASAQVLGTRTAPAPSDTGLLDAVEWAVNLDGRYGFGEIPLDDVRAQKIGRLVQYLDRSGFRGMVLIEVHVGRFCMSLSSDGNLELAPSGDPATACTQLGWPSVEAVALGRRQTLGFANTVVTATNDTGIRVETASAGAERPAVEYPPMGDYLTAGEWNQTAAANHRLEIRLVPDADSLVSRGDARR